MKCGQHNRLLLAVATKEQLITVLKYVLDEKEFLAPYGIRSLSKVYVTFFNVVC